MSNDVELDPINRLKVAVFKLSGLLQEENENYLNQRNLTVSRVRVLGVLTRAGQALTIPQIAHEMGQTRQGVGRLVNLLVKDGFLELKDNPQHRKSNLVDMSGSGVDIYNSLRHEDLQEMPSRHYPISEQQALQALSILEAFIGHLEQ
ncbi:MarR family winged helix-turn-helix transcriptional regulator [Pseudomonas sp. PDM31]|uniref:MarR family winged helix-turn-helix transcriptional regulator n=1 Tax=Pseudomonas sp. PDM31 TaxID=2854778 RepID=UPI001C4687A4|nr:helix-turn-helix domain-containing protein [Pseudomonas sp. PDM31]MBV7477632.1 MarR family transcriptional regulator [Pseudomonas sp. PDM31]